MTMTEALADRISMEQILVLDMTVGLTYPMQPIHWPAKPQPLFCIPWVLILKKFESEKARMYCQPEAGGDCCGMEMCVILQTVVL